MAFGKKESEQLEETYKATIEIKTLLLGVDGNPGMLKRFEELYKSHYGFKRAVISIFGGIVFSGVITLAIILITRY